MQLLINLCGMIQAHSIVFFTIRSTSINHRSRQKALILLYTLLCFILDLHYSGERKKNDWLREFKLFCFYAFNSIKLQLTMKSSETNDSPLNSCPVFIYHYGM